MVKPLLLLPALFALAYFPAPVGTPVPQKDSGASGDKTAGVSAKVKQIYKVDCAMCHGDTGDGKTDLGQAMGVTTDLGDPKTLGGKSDQDIYQIIRKGKDKMPPEDAPRATDDQVRGLVIYIRTFSKDRPATPAAEPAAAPAPPPSAPSTN